MLKIWTHTSIAWWIQKSLGRSYEIWWNWLQIFAKSPRWWNFWLPKLDDSVTKEFFSNNEKYGQNYKMIHSVYLINLAKSPNEATKDVESVIDDFKIASKLWFEAVNVHLGKYWDNTKQQAFDNMCKNLEPILEHAEQTWVIFLFENTTGQGSEVWYDFVELAEFYNYLKDKLWKDYIEKNIQFCFDTAHAWWAWYDINNFENVINEFDKNLGIDKLYCIHLNDSKVPVWTYLDRHANLGRGFMGIYALRKVIQRALKNNIPMILETPDDTLWAEEIQIIKKIAYNELSEWELEEFHRNYFKTEYLKKFQNYVSENSLF